MSRTSLIVIAILLGGSLAFAATVDEDPTEAKVREIAKELRCAVCQNESVYDSRSDLAVQMKELIRDKLKAGESPESIRKYFVSRYGDYILLEPRRQGLNWLIWAGPGAAFLAGSGVLVVYLRRRVRRDRPAAGAPVDAKLKKRLEQEMEKLPDEDVP
ncbi:MAG: cytochrome c-type biogenesis protein CcmH [Nitrospirae bacterium]|nr:cytochrome c-type biogenesis protein CcmH [Nitrospirota bacterium]